jgi:uncharacterized repeat protein (TIGR01451 family)
LALIAVLLLGVITASLAAPSVPASLHTVMDVTLFDAGKLLAPNAPAGKSNLGNYVWWDVNVDGDHTGLAEQEFTLGAGFNNVLINLYSDVDRDGVLDPSEQTPIATTLTGDNPDASGVQYGWYNFDVTADGNKYFVQVDPSNFQPTKPLYGYVQTSESIYGPNVGPSPAWYPMLYVDMPLITQDYMDADFGFAKASVEIIKAPPLQTVLVGKAALFDITVTNTGQVPLTNIHVTDANAPGCDRIIAGPLAAGVGTTYSCQVTSVQDPFFNTARVTQSTPIDPNTGDPAPGTTPTATSNEVEVKVAIPDIDVEKYVSIDGGATWVDADTITGPYLNSGTAPQFKFWVKNTGNVPLSNVSVSDSDFTLPAGCIVSTLAVGEVDECVITAAWAAGQHTDTATATGSFTDDHNNTADVEDTDNANYFGADPKIDVEKYVSIDGGVTWVDADTLTGPYLNSGTAPQFKFWVKNTGNVPLSNVSVSDSDFTLPAGCIVTTLAVGEVDECIITAAWAAGQHTDTATATGTFSDGNNTPKEARDTDDANYFGADPKIDVEKEVSVDGGLTWFDADDAPGPYSSGPTAPIYRFTVTNNGNVPLSGVTLTDSPVMSLFGDIGLTVPCTIPGTLGIGNGFTCFASEPWAAGQHEDTATATGTFTDSNNTPEEASDTDKAHYYGVNPAIDVEKEVSVDNGVTWFDADSPTGPLLPNGVSPRFRFTVKNTGGVPLTSVTLSDSMYNSLIASQCPGLPTTLAVGDSFTCTIIAPYTVGQHVNTATATGVFTDGTVTFPASDTDKAHYLGGKKDIRLIKTAGTAADGTAWIISAPFPVNVLYTYEVTNTGDFALIDIVVTDNLLGYICAIPGPLAPGASDTCTKTAPISEDTQNLGTATGTAVDAQGNPVGTVADDDDALVLTRGRIGDFVWWDVNFNGVQDPGEPGIPGVDVTLPALGRIVTTDANGYYSFDQLASGNYQVVIPAYELAAGGSLEGFARTSAFLGGDPAKDSNGTAGAGGSVQALVSLPANTADLTIDFGFTKPSGYRIEKQRISTSPVRPGERVHFRITVYNTGQTWLTTVPLKDSYDMVYLSYGYPQPSPAQWSNPASDDNNNDGQINWSNVAPAGGIPPSGNVVIDVYFTAKADTTALQPNGQTINIATVQGVFGDPDGPDGPTPPADLGLPPQEAQAGVMIIAPTGVEITGLGASVEEGGVRLTWETASEHNIIGFNVLRIAAGGVAVAVNAELIFAEYAGAAVGTAYSLFDSGAASGAYTYVLEVLSLDGSAARIELGQVSF